jgi:hypothetical protein
MMRMRMWRRIKRRRRRRQTYGKGGRGFCGISERI